MLRKSAAVLAVVLSVSNVSAVRAEPGPVVNWLMNEPASVFDIGMLRLEIGIRWWYERQEITKISKRRPGGIAFWPSYSFLDNRITMFARRIGEDMDTSERKSVCRELIDFMSREALVDPKTGQLFGGSKASSFSQYFQHSDYVNTSEPSNLQPRLDRIFVLKAFVVSEPQQTICRRALMSNKVYFEE